MLEIDNVLDNLSKSKFRSSFHLKQKETNYVNEKGIDKIKEHTSDFILKRLAPSIIPNDGKQTPYHGHPTFIAQHATATCCRECLYKWHHISKNKDLTIEEQKYIVSLIIKWIQNEIKR